MDNKEENNKYIIKYLNMKEEYILEVPENVRYISEWKNLQLPKGHYIMDKVVTGCGFTEFFLNNSIICKNIL